VTDPTPPRQSPSSSPPTADSHSRPAYTGTGDYIAAPELLQTVEVARRLGRPLLIKGEPGTGKTMLAVSIAEGLRMPLITWTVKSTTKAQDGLYVYDTVQRLYDGQFGEGDVSDIARYIKLGKLGEAFTAPEQVVLLIDEIDKADLEFPNDLLHELDQMSFVVRETGRQIAAVQRPVVVITSNAEKELPDAFLRRCVFHYIEFPPAALMEEIVAVHFPDIDDHLITQALMKFYWLREQPEVRKKPSTSELLDWLNALRRGGIEPSALQGGFPFLGVLLKKEADLQAMQRRIN
jgi:MoxR-like ATPase